MYLHFSLLFEMGETLNVFPPPLFPIHPEESYLFSSFRFYASSPFRDRNLLKASRCHLNSPFPSLPFLIPRRLYWEKKKKVGEKMPSREVQGRNSPTSADKKGMFSVLSFARRKWPACGNAKSVNDSPTSSSSSSLMCLSVFFRAIDSSSFSSSFS